LAKLPPAGVAGSDEIKHDGLRIVARRADDRVQLLTRKGNDFLSASPQIIAALTALSTRSCLIDGEAIVCNESSLAVFDLIRGYRAAVLCVFDLLELDGEDMAHPDRDASQAHPQIPARSKYAGIVFNQHFDTDGVIVYRHACALGSEGIVSKSLASPPWP
jgi:bifunctional non-homologous end joining protein LigD